VSEDIPVTRGYIGGRGKRGNMQRGAAGPTSLAADRGDLDQRALDAAVAEVAEKSTWWADLTPGARADLLEATIRSTLDQAPAWLEAACHAKDLDPTSSAAGEELFSGIGTFVRMARTLIDSLRDLDAGRQPQFPGPVTESPDGRLVVGVFPASTFDRVLYAGTTGQVWIESGVTRSELERDQAGAYKDRRAHAGVSLVLGAGNVASLGPRDVLTKLFVEGHTVLLKANPVNDYLVPHWNGALAPLVRAGVLRIVTGGAAAGAYLCRHELIDDIHVTGSDKTFDAIVYGTGEEGAANKASDSPIVTKPVTGELGSVSPVIVVPGVWSHADIAYQAEHVATMLANNAGFNCLTPRVLITWKHWPQREAFMTALSDVLRKTPARRAYYPGAQERYRAFKDAHPDLLELGGAQSGTLPWAIVTDVDARSVNDICFNVEAFCSLTSETALDAESEAAFVDAAVTFANDVVWGSLSATILAHPTSLADPEVGPRIEDAIAKLRYGSIGVNLWHAISFALGVTTWGAYPGHARNDIQSGVGVVGNAFMLEHTVKSVVRGPFRAKPKPAWFVTSRSSLAVMTRLLAFEAQPSWRRLPGLMVAALRS
jgi:acyl-CoA reductase-like NAD-dependent aldehyde dehydrogenase